MSIEELKRKSILDVAADLGVPLKRISGSVYEHKDHDSLRIFADTNSFKWFSRDIQGDVINFVQLIKDVSLNEALFYLGNGEFKPIEFKEVKREPFRYHLQPYENPNISEARIYLRDERLLSDETIDFFKRNGVLAEAVKKTNAYYEPVIVFKFLDRLGKLEGASLQGIRENKNLYDRGRLKQTMMNSDGTLGMSVAVGQPRRLVFFEAPIDLMSYYELNQSQLSDVRLVAMEGFSENLISRYALELIGEMRGQKDYLDSVERSKWKQTLSTIAKTTPFFKEHPDFITIAVDNDEAGNKFLSKLQEKGLPVMSDLPPLLPGQTKSDWNDILKQEKSAQLFHSSHRDLNTVIAQAQQESRQEASLDLETVYEYADKASKLFEQPDLDRQKFAFLLAHHDDGEVYNQYAVRSDFVNEMMAITRLYVEYKGDKAQMIDAASARGLLADKEEFLRQYAKDFIKPALNHSSSLEA
ncbi:DNA primase [Streptococcus sp. E17BB]|uniref:DNA primase n=1 Tax=Streptococcus sp. E17BB TaxID=3278714 RepID=UPI00359DA040